MSSRSKSHPKIQNMFADAKSGSQIDTWLVEKGTSKSNLVGAKGKLDSTVGWTQMYYWHRKIEIARDPTDRLEF